MITAQCALLFLWVLGTSYGMWICAKGRPEKPPGKLSDFFASLLFAIAWLLLYWKAGAFSKLIGGAS